MTRRKRAKVRRSWLDAVKAILRRWPVLSIEGVAKMDNETLNEHLLRLDAEDERLTISAVQVNGKPYGRVDSISYGGQTQ